MTGEDPEQGRHLLKVQVDRPKWSIERYDIRSCDNLRVGCVTNQPVLECSVCRNSAPVLADKSAKDLWSASMEALPTEQQQMFVHLERQGRSCLVSLIMI